MWLRGMTQNKIIGRELSETGRDGNDSRKTEVIYLQPSQTLSRAKDGNEASYAENEACVSLGAQRKKETER